MYLAGCWIAEQPVDREIASHGVVPGICEPNAVGTAMVRVRPLLAECRHFDGQPVPAYEHDSKGSADRYGAREDLQNLLRRGVGGDVVVLGLESEQFVADAAACEPRCESFGLQ